MRFFTVLAVLAGVVTALPQPVTEPESPANAALNKRGCNVNCVTSCCKSAGCNGYLHCDGSYCYTSDAGHSWCECNCRYG
ncbi:hypothetical protein F5144DRAFT_552918 [Chaetomium tenue]|uniref:Uncharacterized protein n=1 Tax=Chaetomium tenue TaxID=1854479 RepID=A0ACB7PMA2_9PEZI|nr:hypothetical protein F5144DRAFT_552918 [Chaetomium globosum]